MNEAQRSPKTNFVNPVFSDTQKILNKVNKLLEKEGFLLMPSVRMDIKTPSIAKFFLKRYSKYLVPSFGLRPRPEGPAPVKKRRTRRKKKK